MIPIMLYDEKGFKDIYLAKPSLDVVSKKNYFKSSKYEKPSELFGGLFCGSNTLSYGDPLDILMSLE